MRLVFPAALAAAWLASLAGAPTARAMGAIVSDPPGASSAVALRIAVAAGDGFDAGSGQTARWASVSVQGSAKRFAWIIPARPGALLGLAPDAWLESLESATAPQVVPPDATPPCGFQGGVEVDGSFTPTATTTPESSGVAADRAALDALLAGWGMSIGPDLAPAIDAVLASGSELVTLLFVGTGEPGTVVTRTMRVVDDAPASVPLSLVTGGAAAVQVTAYAVRPASTELGAVAQLELNPADVLWRDDGTSTYAAARDLLLDANPGRWLVETTGPYATLVGGDGDAGTSDDATIALAAVGSGDAWLTRARSLVAPSSFGADAVLASADVAPFGPIVHASGYAQTCEASVPPVPTQGPGSVGVGGSGSGQTTGSNPQGTSSGAAVDLGAGAAQVAGSGGGCSGDSTDDSSGDGCGGDTSSSTDGSDSSSSDSGSGCSGSSPGSSGDSGDSGGGCSGSSDSSSSDCSVNARGSKTNRSETSRFLLLLVGLSAWWRRRRRGRT